MPHVREEREVVLQPRPQQRRAVCGVERRDGGGQQMVSHGGAFGVIPQPPQRACGGTSEQQGKE